jgi:hypothetical protein
MKVTKEREVNKMLQHYVNSDSYASLVHLDRDLEIMPEPFRCQGNKVTFILTLDEYIKYLSNYSYLYSNAKELNELLKMYRPGQNHYANKKLFSYFLKDVSNAIMKEIYFAEWREKRCTLIVHSANSNDEMDENDIDNLFDGIPGETKKAIILRLQSKGYNVTLPISEINMRYWKYAVLAYFLAEDESNPTWSYKINN